jgi:hypothetical protein
MKSSQGEVTGKGQIIGPDGKVKAEFEIRGQVETAESKQEDIDNGSDSRDSRSQRNR